MIERWQMFGKVTCRCRTGDHEPGRLRTDFLYKIRLNLLHPTLSDMEYMESLKGMFPIDVRGTFLDYFDLLRLLVKLCELLVCEKLDG